MNVTITKGTTPIVLASGDYCNLVADSSCVGTIAIPGEGVAQTITAGASYGYGGYSVQREVVLNIGSGSISVEIGQTPASIITPAGATTLQALVSGDGIAVYAPPDSSTVTIAATAYAAFLAGGGIVQLPRGKITLTSALPLYRGVIYQGALVGTQMHSTSTDATDRFGTVLLGDWSFPGFSDGQTAAGSEPTNYTTFMNGMVRGAGVRNVCLRNFSHGIKLGEKWAPGGQFCEFKNILAEWCNWGYWFENFIECNFEDLSFLDCTVGGGMFKGTGGTALNNGNSTLRKMFGEFGTGQNGVKERGWVFMAEGNTAMNALTVSSIQTNRVRGFTNSDTFTFTNGQAGITVPDATKFPVDMPLVFGSSAAGFVANRVYFVVASAGTSVQLSATQGGAAISATASTTATGTSYGFPGVEVVAKSPARIQPCQFYGVDIEGNSTARMVVQGAQSCFFDMGYSSEGIGTAAAVGVVMRSSVYCSICGSSDYSGAPLSFDIDTASKTTLISGPRASEGPYGGQTGVGMGVSVLANASNRTKAQSAQVFLSGEYGPDIALNNKSGYHQVDFPSYPIGFRTNAFDTGGNVYTTSLNAYKGSGAGSVTLPTIASNGDGAFLIVSNPTANALTVNAPSGQNINNTSASVTVAANTTAIFAACDNGTVKYWAKV